MTRTRVCEKCCKHSAVAEVLHSTPRREHRRLYGGAASPTLSAVSRLSIECEKLLLFVVTCNHQGDLMRTFRMFHGGLEIIIPRRAERNDLRNTRGGSKTLQRNTLESGGGSCALSLRDRPYVAVPPAARWRQWDVAERNHRGRRFSEPQALRGIPSAGSLTRRVLLPHGRVPGTGCRTCGCPGPRWVPNTACKRWTCWNAKREIRLLVSSTQLS